jgi:hypothetical protein
MTILDPQKVVEEIQRQTISYVKKYNISKIVILPCINYISQKRVFSSIVPQLIISETEVTEPVIVFTPFDKSEIYLRHFTKYSELNKDFIPFADLFESEIKELAIYLKHIEIPLTAKEKDDEWLVRQDLNNQIISSTNDPTKSQAWLGYTKEQRELVAKEWSKFHLNDHKKLMGFPVLLRHIPGLVR